jgi:transposase
MEGAMAAFTPNKYPVRLSDEQRRRLERLTAAGSAPARKARSARVLLLADKGRDGGGWTDPAIAGALSMHVNTVARVRKRFVTAGETPALDRKPRETPPRPAKIDGRAEAHLVAICCSPAPEGRARWSLRLLAAEMTRRGVVTEVGHEAVRRALKKTGSSLGSSGPGASPSGTRPGSPPRWRTSSTCTPPNTRRKSR